MSELFPQPLRTKKVSLVRSGEIDLPKFSVSDMFSDNADAAAPRENDIELPTTSGSRTTPPRSGKTATTTPTTQAAQNPTPQPNKRTHDQSGTLPPSKKPRTDGLFTTSPKPFENISTTITDTFRTSQPAERAINSELLQYKRERQNQIGKGKDNAFDELLDKF